MCFNRQLYILILRAWKKEGNSTSLGLWKCFTSHQTTAYAVQWSEECSDFYMGETKQPLRKHTAQHRRALRSLPRHFSSRLHLASGDWIGPMLGWGEVSQWFHPQPPVMVKPYTFFHTRAYVMTHWSTVRQQPSGPTPNGTTFTTGEIPGTLQQFFLELKLGLVVKCFHKPEVAKLPSFFSSFQEYMTNTDMLMS